MFSVVILAGGSGSRMHKNVPKQFLALAGKPIILHTLERLEKIDTVDEVIISCHSDYKELLRLQIEAYMLRKEYKIIDGGNIRQESAYLGVKEAKNNDIIMHEAARPFVKATDFKALMEYPADNVTYGMDIPFTVSVCEDNLIMDLLKRDRLVNVQLPQKFKRDSLLNAYRKAEKDGAVFTEDTSMLFQYGKEPIFILPGMPYNIKITDPIDLITGEMIYKEYIVERD